MKTDGWNDERACPECEHPVRVAFYPGDKGRTYGRPEDCWPPENADLDYEHAECQGCGYEFTDRDILRWIDDIEEENKDHAEHYEEERDEHD